MVARYTPTAFSFPLLAGQARLHMANELVVGGCHTGLCQVLDVIVEKTDVIILISEET